MLPCGNGKEPIPKNEKDNGKKTGRHLAYGSACQRRGGMLAGLLWQKGVFHTHEAGGLVTFWHRSAAGAGRALARVHRLVRAQSCA